MGSRASGNARPPGKPNGEGNAGHQHCAEAAPATQAQPEHPLRLPAQPPVCSPSLIYPPTRAQWVARAGGLWREIPDPAKFICMGLAKNGLAS